MKQIQLQHIKNDPNWKAKKKAQKNTACPYNEGLICEKKECYRCGFNPKVAQARTEAIIRKLGEV